MNTKDLDIVKDVNFEDENVMALMLYSKKCAERLTLKLIKGKKDDIMDKERGMILACNDFSTLQDQLKKTNSQQ